MSRRIQQPMLLLSLSLLLGCPAAEPGPADTPEQCLKRFVAAVEQPDVGALGGTLVPINGAGVRAQVELWEVVEALQRTAEVQYGEPLDQLPAGLEELQEAWANAPRVRVGPIQVDGDRAIAGICIQHPSQEPRYGYVHLFSLEVGWRVGMLTTEVELGEESKRRMRMLSSFSSGGGFFVQSLVGPAVDDLRALTREVSDGLPRSECEERLAELSAERFGGLLTLEHLLRTEFLEPERLLEFQEL